MGKVITSLFCSAILAQSSAFHVEQPIRLALTPILDGVVSDGEWESLSDSAGATFFQWEPGKLYWAAKPLPGQDVILSFDMSNDGWLTGKDNYEIRASQVKDQIRLSIRQLDATDRNNPVWVSPDLAAESFKVVSKPSQEYWNLEGSFTPILGKVPSLNDQLGIRLECVSATTEELPPYLPKVMAPVRLRFDQSSNLFSGVTWHPEFDYREVARVENLEMKLRFKLLPETSLLQTIRVEGEGLAQNAISPYQSIFPDIDRGGNATVKYSSPINDAAIGGYRIVRAVLTDSNNDISVLRTSVKIADLVEMKISLPQEVTFDSDNRSVRGFVSILSRTKQDVRGHFDYSLPDYWEAKKGTALDFRIINPRDEFRVPIEFDVPTSAKGAYPFNCVIEIDGKKIYETVYVTIR